MGDLVRENGMVEVDFDELLKDADPQIGLNMQLFKDIGTHCKAMDSAHEDLGRIVRDLSTHDKINEDTLDKYTSHLRQLLRMREDQLPARMSITAALPKWITAGDEVDGQDKSDAWWHRAILSTSASMPATSTP